MLSIFRQYITVLDLWVSVAPTLKKKLGSNLKKKNAVHTTNLKVSLLCLALSKVQYEVLLSNND